MTSHNYTYLANGVDLFYKESGSASAPVLLLLHGFPTSSRQFGRLIPLLNSKFHIIAPDLPTFGLTKVPAGFDVSFEAIAKTIELFLDQLQITTFSVYIFDYGAPTGLRLALNPKFTIQSIISQNGNAYVEGLGSFWDPLKIAWELVEKKTRTAQENAKLEEIKEELGKLATTYEPYHQQYYEGEPDPSLVNPEDPLIDFNLLSSKPNVHEDQVKLFIDYRKNIQLYPAFHAYFSRTNVPILAVWGVHDQIFLEAGQKAYTRHSKRAQLVDLPAGHFAGSHYAAVAAAILRFAEGIEM